MVRARSFPNWVRLGSWLLVMPVALQAAAVPLEYDLKAAYLFNVLRFVDRRDAQPGGAYFTLGILGADAIRSSMARLEGSPIRGRKLRIRTINVESELAGCDVVFFGNSTARTHRMLGKAADSGLLTVGNDSDFIPSGGMVALVVESRRVVVEVNEKALDSVGWAISSHLLEVARIVKGAGR